MCNTKSTFLSAIVVALFTSSAYADGMGTGEDYDKYGNPSNKVPTYQAFKAKNQKAAQLAEKNGSGLALTQFEEATTASKVAANKYPSKEDVFGGAQTGGRSPFLDTKQAVYQYDPNESYPVLARTNMFTQIDLPEGSKVDGFYLSDTDEENWVHYVSKDERHIFIQALKGGLFNSGSIISGNQTYLLAINSSDTGNWFQRVKWVMPKKHMATIAKQSATADGEGISQAQKSKFYESYEVPSKAPVEVIKGINADALNTKWKIEGDAAFRPSSVYNDDEMTYLEFPESMAEMPALFSISESSKEPELVNYTVTENGRYKVNKVLTAGLLKLGKKEVKITNMKVVAGTSPKNQTSSNQTSVFGGR